MNADHLPHNAHQRLLAGDPTVSAELAQTVTPLLVQYLRQRFPQCNDEDLFQDAAHEAFINYVIQPQQFNPQQRKLLGYLKMSAEGDFKNFLAKKSRSEKNLQSGVELEEFAGNKPSESDPAQQSIANEQHRRWRQILPNPVDHQILDLMAHGVRDTEEFARVLRIDDLSPEQQQEIVKRHKDRIKITIKRYEESIRKRE